MISAVYIVKLGVRGKEQEMFEAIIACCVVSFKPQQIGQS